MAPPLDHDPVAGAGSNNSRRKIMNRESARRSRVKKQLHLHHLLRDIDSFKRQNSEISLKLGQMERKRGQMQAEIDHLDAEKCRLERKLSRLMELVKSVEMWKINRGDEDEFRRRLAVIV